MFAAVSRGFMRRMCAPERHGIPVRVHLLVVEVVVSLQVRPEGRVVLLRRQDQRSTAPPAAHELRGDQFLFLGRLAVRAQEVAERADVLLQSPVGQEAAVAGEDLRLGQAGDVCRPRRGSRGRTRRP